MSWLYGIIDTIQRFALLGGPLIWVIAGVLVLMWTLILERFWYISMVHPKLARQILADWDARADTTSWYAHRVRDYWLAESRAGLQQNLGVIKALIALCPLLGLLGTVSGMIVVFEIMAVVGTGNARAMAAGVSQATVPTMAGMVAALSGVFAQSRLDRVTADEQEALQDALVHH